MKILDIHIYGYGKLENYQISSLQGLQVFYGENEAGKSTIMSFIHSILFGFPGKQGSELRYEPKNHSKYGGKLKVSFPGKGVAVIERVKGKAAGDVTVSLEDGTIGDEELLKDLLGRMDKNIYQGIFSFNVHGLQNVHSLRGEDLGRYLFSAGTLGTDKLFNAESILQKEMDQRFKPSGKKPLLNEKLKELKELQAALKSAEQQNERYAQLLAERDAGQERSRQIDEEISRLENEIARLKEYKRNEKLVIEEAGLKKKLEHAGHHSFPQDGISRLDKIEQQVKQKSARLLLLEDKKAAIHAEAEECKPDSSLLEMESEIFLRLEKLSMHDQMKQEKKLLELKVEELTEEISQINDSLHIDFTEEKIKSVDTSVFTRERAESTQLQQQRLSEKKRELEAAFEEEKTVLVEMEKQAARLEKELLPETERTRLTEELAVFDKKETIKLELDQVKAQIAAYRARMKSDKERRGTQKKRDLYQFVLIGGLFLILAIWGIMNGQWLLAFAGAIGIILMAALHFKSAADMKKAADDEGFPLLIERERLLEEKLGRQPDVNSLEMKNALLNDEERRQRHRELLVKIQQQNLRYEKVIQQFEKWESEEAQLRKDKADLLEKLGLSEFSAPAKVLDAFILIEKQKQLFRERKRTEDRLRAISDALIEIDHSFRELGERFLANPEHTPAELGVLLKKKLREAVANKARYDELQSKLEEMEEEQTALQKELIILVNEKQELFSQAGAGEEDQFRQAAELDRQRKEWISRQSDISYQLEVSGLLADDKERILTGPPLDDQVAEKTELAAQYKNEQTRLLDQLAQVKHNIGLLEQGGIYSELLHKYKQLKHEFEEDAKDWAKYAIANDLLLKTINRYKEDRMPKMISEAERFLACLTDGQYIRIVAQDAGAGFLVERKDHMLFEASELSQATAEQVYVSIRLALALIHLDRYPLPLVIDDSFVNFDHIRAARMIGLLREFTNNQIMIFTCHRHILDHFTESEIIMLGENGPIEVGEKPLLKLKEY